MPRGPRLDTPGALHHVMARGIERRRIFKDDVDRADFVVRLDRLSVQNETALYAWCLLPNHFHLLVRTGAAPLSTFMRRLLTGYAGAFNRRHRRVGHLLQNRFKSIVVDEDRYLLELVRYIHLNPVRAGLVANSEALEAYEWAGHGALLGKPRLRAQDVNFVLRQFGRTMGAARAAYRQFVCDGVTDGRQPELSGGGLRRSLRGWESLTSLPRGREHWASDERILGSSDFVLRTLRELPRPAPGADQRDAAAAALEVVARRCGLGVAEIRSNSHRPGAVRARAIVTVIAVRRHGLTPTAVAALLGISRRSVARALERAQQLLSLNLDLGDLLR
jgi:REP element-mobilizing transposase RayT